MRRLVMDEFALHKGHRYATVVICADTQQVLWVGEGSSRAAVRPFFAWLGPAVCQQIEAVAMDMNTAFDLEVQRHCPNAAMVYDLFHVIAKFGREVVDRVRVEQATRLEELLAANAPLMTVYLLKTQLKELWYAPSPHEARRRWQE